MRKKRLMPARLGHAKLSPWKRVVSASVFPLSRGSKAGVVFDRGGMPRVFVFDTFALLDVLSAVDARLLDRLSDEEYHSKDANPAGWLIDELEAKLPVRESYLQSLKAAIAEATRKGWVPFDAVERALQAN